MKDAADRLPESNSGPLSYGQRALWFLQQLAPANAAYNVILAARSNSALEAGALRRACQSLVNRHPSLRTIFPAIKGKPVQKVRPRQEVDFHVIDCPAVTPDQLLDLVTRKSHEPFDLEAGPLLRVTLFAHSPREQILSLVMHHIVADFLSVAIIVDDLRALYAAEAAGKPALLPNLNAQYLDYARWQSEMLEGPEGERLWAYWRKQLSGDLPALDLPTDRPRLPLQSYRGATRTAGLSEEMTRRVISCAEAEGVSLFAILLASFQLLLSRYSGRSGIVVGSPPVHSRRGEFQGVVGFFHNPIVLRADLSGDPSFKVFLSQVERTALEAFEHREYPFSLLVERLQPARDPSRSPLFQVMFVLYESGDPALLSFLSGDAQARIDLGGAELQSLGVQQRAAMLDLTLTVVQSGGILTTCVQYNTDLFDDTTVERMMADYERVLEAVTADPEQRASELVLSDGFTRRDRRRAEVRKANAVETAGVTSAGPMEFSLFYFASDDSDCGDHKYSLLLDGARFADRNGFSAVWTPERHFHAFGGLYPNPSVTGAAIAAITEQVHIRAGSVVLPLHNPVRVAEEWAVVDNLSKGRVGLSFASGWHSDDFIFAPDNFANRREVMAGYIEIVRRLWRGESISFTGGAGNEVQVKIMPRPIQRELPFWITAFGSVDTFRLAGDIGANMLTHLLGQSVEMLEEKIKLYRKAWRDHGHGPGTGHVTVMLHTFVGDDFDAVREKVREPFCSYLKSSLDQLIGLATSSGMDLDPKHLTQENIDALVTHAFNRYYESCGLFGTPDTCIRMVEKLSIAGVDEIACLIDFGVDAESVLSGLRCLTELKDQCETKFAQRRGEDGGNSVCRQSADLTIAPAISLEETRSRAESRRSLMTRQRMARAAINKKQQ